MLFLKIITKTTKNKGVEVHISKSIIEIRWIINILKRKKMKENMHYRNITLSTRVSAAQKAEYVKISASHNISVSEWMASVIEMNKFSYGKIGDPTPNEIKQKRENELLKKQLQKTIVQRDTSDEYAANMQERSNKAVRDRDESNYALKVAVTENDKLKRRINAIESLMGRERTVNKVDIHPEETIGFSVLTILTVVLLGFK